MTWKTQPRSRVGDLYAITAGEGPQILLIHGVGLRAETWGAQIEALSESGRVIAVDMPGHGQSSALDDPGQLTDFTDIVSAICTEPVVVIGHSFGAMIALDMAIRYPEKVWAVAALNAIHQRGGVAKATVLSRAAELSNTAMADPSTTLERWFGATPSPEREACKNWLCAVNPKGYRDAYRVFATEDGPSEQDLKNLRCPALFLTGANEPNSTPIMSQRMAALAPQGRSEIVPGASHMLPMTHPNQVNAVLEQFIKRHGT